MNLSSSKGTLKNEFPSANISFDTAENMLPKVLSNTASPDCSRGMADLAAFVEQLRNPRLERDLRAAVLRVRPFRNAEAKLATTDLGLPEP